MPADEPVVGAVGLRVGNGIHTHQYGIAQNIEIGLLENIVLGLGGLDGCGMPVI